MILFKKHTRFAILLILLLSEHELAAQKVTLRRAEWLWAIGHPIAAIKVKKIKSSCDLIYTPSKTSSYLDKFETGGTLDAYRHVFYMAAFAQKVKIKKLKKLGKKAKIVSF